jgi:hypothetical protein
MILHVCYKGTSLSVGYFGSFSYEFVLLCFFYFMIRKLTCRYFGGCPSVNIPGTSHPVQIYFLDDLPQLMGHHSVPAARLGVARSGTVDDEDVDCELIASVVAWVAQYYAQGDGAILCFLPVRFSKTHQSA